MNNWQLFRMYRRFMQQRADAEDCRRSNFRPIQNANWGIAVDNDQYARAWQKWNRLSKSAASELEWRLSR
jgi:hypothetical protein